MQRVAWFLAVLTALAGCARDEAPLAASITVAEALAAPTDPRFARALEPREFVFPADHGPHAEFQTEWWYFTGNLADSGGREFGYQLTFFRRAVAFEAPASDSAWSARDVYMAHFTVGDATSGAFRAFERFERAALDLAGAESSPWRVWLRDWSASGDLDDGEVRLVAEQDGVRVDLALRRASAIVLHGERGLSQKGRERGAASHYYSIPRLDTRGTLRIDGREVAVSGASWFDREFFTGALEPGQVGWDWFALRFDDGSSLMLYRLRRDDGSSEATSSGTFVDADGRATRLALPDFRIEELATWTSERTGVRYPSRWRIAVEKLELELEIEPLVPRSELVVSLHYWEGAVRARAKRGTRELAARGFVELAGYGASSPSDSRAAR